jgi:hypothetical protein
VSDWTFVTGHLVRNPLSLVKIIIIGVFAVTAASTSFIPPPLER